MAQISKVFKRKKPCFVAPTTSETLAPALRSKQIVGPALQRETAMHYTRGQFDNERMREDVQNPNLSPGPSRGMQPAIRGRMEEIANTWKHEMFLEKIGSGQSS